MKTKLFLFVCLLYILIFLALLALDQKTPLDEWPEYSFPTQGADSTDYTKLANNLIEHRLFSLRTGPPFVPDAMRTPGYPLFLAATKTLFGSFHASMIIQIVLMGIVGILILVIGKKLFSERIGFSAALLYLLEPTTIFHSITIMSDAFFLFPLMAAIYLLFFSERQNRCGMICLAGISLGYAVLVRPVGMFLPVLFIPFLFFLRIGQQNIKSILLSILIFLLGYSLMLTPWALRNKNVTGTVGISAVGNHQLAKFDLPMFLSVKKNISIAEANAILAKELHTNEIDCSLEKSALCWDFFLKYFHQYPFDYIWFHLKSSFPILLTSSLKTLTYSIPPLEKKLENLNWLATRQYTPVSNLLFRGQWKMLFDFYHYKLGFFFVLEYLFWGTILSLALASLLRFRKHHPPQNKKGLTFLLFALVVYFAILSAPITAPRYRLSLEPFLFLLACAGSAALWQHWRGQKKLEKPLSAC